MVMQTIQTRHTKQQLRAVDKLVKKGVYPNRSEAFRAAVRKLTGVE